MTPFNQLPCPLLVTNNAGQVLEVNRDFCALVGYTPPKEPPYAITALFAPASRIFLQIYGWPVLLQKGRIDDVFLHLLDASAQHIPVLLNCQKSEIPSGTHYYWVFFAVKESKLFESDLLYAHNRAELMAAHLAQSQAHADLKVLHHQLALHADLIQNKNRELTNLCQTDPLTGMANRRALAARVAQWRNHVPLGSSASLLMVDVDHFKRVNDVHGHDAGDKVLTTLALQLQSSLRVSDLAVRYGGEEFVVWLPMTDDLGAAHAARRIHECVQQVRVAGQAITVSIGAATACYTAGTDLLQLLTHNADMALYEAKAAGRHCTAHFDPLA